MLEWVMALLSRVLVPLFIAGMAGSSLVVVITFAHDVLDYFAKDDAGAVAGQSN